MSLLIPPTPRKSSGKPTIEGISTRNAEYYGWRLGNNLIPDRKMTNLVRSIWHGLKAIGSSLYDRIESAFNIIIGL